MTRAITDRRLAAAKRAINKVREQIPLFAEQDKLANETPRERCERLDREAEDRFAYWFVSRAGVWLDSIEKLRFIQRLGGDPLEIIAKFKAGFHPKSSEYAATHLSEILKAVRTLQRAGMWNAGPQFELVWMNGHYNIEVSE